MDKLIIAGGRPLEGTVPVGGAKNAILPCMAAALLTAEPVRLAGVPNYRDVRTMTRILHTLGVGITHAGETVDIEAREITETTAPYELVRTMRASIFVLGPLLARTGRAKVALPGGCAIGARPVDLHLKGLAALGAVIELKDGYVEAEGRALKGARVVLDFPSVGATENVMMAASTASGTTTIENAAREPEITDLADLLNAMGAQVRGAGTDSIVIEGVRNLHGADHRPIPDRVEAATYLILSLLTGGRLSVAGANRQHLHALEAAFDRIGARMTESGAGLAVAKDGRWKSTDVATAPYPGFPTDMQAQWMVLMSLAEGSAVIRETVFENRFQHAPELTRLGADISIKGSTAIVRGVPELKAAPVMVSDLRAGAAMVLAGLAAKGTTEVQRIYHLDRGYDRLVEKLQAVGAGIDRVPGPPT